jgi:hypothetical protein
MTHWMDDNWLYIEGKRGGRPYTASVRVPFGPARWPEYDHHVTVVLRYAPHWRTGLPKPKELTRLQDFEDRMIESLGDLGALVATETTDMHRTIHARLPEGEVLEMYREWERRDEGRGVSVTVTHDPEWATVPHLLEVAGRAAA